MQDPDFASHVNSEPITIRLNSSDDDKMLRFDFSNNLRMRTCVTKPSGIVYIISRQSERTYKYYASKDENVTCFPWEKINHALRSSETNSNSIRQ